MPKARTTCTECSVRRQKCNRQSPCERCVKRGIPEKCTRTWPDKERARSHRGLSRRLRQERDRSVSLIESTGDPESDLITPTPEPRLGSSAQVTALSTHASFQRRPTISPLASEHANNDLIPESCEHVRHDRDQSSFDEPTSSSEPLQREVPCLVAPPSPLPAGFPDLRTTSLAILNLQLPPTARIWDLVDYHERFLLWYHGCYHGPTFRHELETTLRKSDGILDLARMNLQWAALLFSIIAGSMACANEQTVVTWGFQRNEISKLSRQWYRATATCLNLAEYTHHHQIYAVHAITTLTMSAHTLGFSEDLSVMLGSALRIAQSLGLNKLGVHQQLEYISDMSGLQQRDKVLEREKGRRLWSQLCVQDWFSLPSTGCQSIGLTDFTTSKPSNRDHVTMAPLPATTPTYVSYGNYLNDIARLIAEHHVSMSRSSTPFLEYANVLEFDAKMRDLARNRMPDYFNVTSALHEEWPEFVPWARRSLTICFAHKMIMIHRAFIRRSFTNPAFQTTRITCIAASKTILREAKNEQREDGPVIWIDQASCIVAGIILCLDVFHRGIDDPEYAIHTQMVHECIDMLRQFQNSMVARRGVCTLSKLLTERKKSGQPLSSNRRATASEATTLQEHRIDLSDVLDGLVMHKDDYPLNPLEYFPETPVGQNLDSGNPGFADKKFAELLPPQAGLSNQFLFGDLLNFA